MGGESPKAPIRLQGTRMTMAAGWNGTLARHEDGRTGLIRANPGWCWIDLHIEDAGVEIGRVRLATDGPDRGEPGWLWHHQDEWLPLGEFPSVAADGAL